MLCVKKKYPCTKRYEVSIHFKWGRHGRDRMVIVQSVSITTNVVSLNSVHGEVYSIQHYVIKFVSDLGQVDGLLRILRCPPSIKLTATI